MRNIKCKFWFQTKIFYFELILSDSDRQHAQHNGTNTTNTNNNNTNSTNVPTNTVPVVAAAVTTPPKKKKKKKASKEKKPRPKPGEILMLIIQ